MKTMRKEITFLTLSLCLTAAPAARSDDSRGRWTGHGTAARVGQGLASGFGALDPSDDSREQSIYERGQRALDERRWDRALETFSEVIRLGGSRKDGALYYKAYAQNKQGQRAEALATLGELTKGSPNSRWLNDARALEVEIRQASGQAVSPENQADEDLKLIAINGLMNSDPERAIPLLEKFLQGNQPPKLKERALFVLSQSGSSKARETVAQIARGNSNPDLQLKALNYLGLFGGKGSRDVLAEIYASSSDHNVKRAILRGFMVSGERDRLFEISKSEKDEQLRMEAINQLGVMGAQSQLWELYQTDSSTEVRARILNAMFVGGNADKLYELAKIEKDPKLRRTAINKLGLMGGTRTGDWLVEIYNNDKDASIRKEVINALFIQGNAKVLVALARKETDPAMKREIVNKLSIMNSKDATDYLLEILNK